MAVKVTTRPTYERGTRVSVRLSVESWEAPRPLDLINEISEALQALSDEGIEPSDTYTGVEVICGDGHDLHMEVYGFRPATKAESAKVRREAAAEKKRQLEWHRAQLARLEEGTR